MALVGGGEKRKEQDKSSFFQGAEGRKAWPDRHSAFITGVYILGPVLSLKAKPRQEPAPPFHVLGAMAQARGHSVETGSLTLTPAQRPRTAESSLLQSQGYPQ